MPGGGSKNHLQARRALTASQACTQHVTHAESLVCRMRRKFLLYSTSLSPSFTYSARPCTQGGEVRGRRRGSANSDRSWKSQDRGWQGSRQGVQAAAPPAPWQAGACVPLAFLKVARVMSGVSTASMVSPMFSISTVEPCRQERVRGQAGECTRHKAAAVTQKLASYTQPKSTARPPHLPHGLLHLQQHVGRPHAHRHQAALGLPLLDPGDALELRVQHQRPALCTQGRWVQPSCQ